MIRVLLLLLYLRDEPWLLRATSTCMTVIETSRFTQLAISRNAVQCSRAAI